MVHCCCRGWACDWAFRCRYSRSDDVNPKVPARATVDKCAGARVRLRWPFRGISSSAAQVGHHTTLASASPQSGRIRARCRARSGLVQRPSGAKLVDSWPALRRTSGLGRNRSNFRRRPNSGEVGDWPLRPKLWRIRSDLALPQPKSAVLRCEPRSETLINQKALPGTRAGLGMSRNTTFREKTTSTGPSIKHQAMTKRRFLCSRASWGALGRRALNRAHRSGMSR